MDRVLINNWNSLIKPEDKVYHLGDVSFISDKYVDKLNGQITLICGNHDKKRFNYLFSEVKETIEMKIDKFKCLLTHRPIIEDGIYKKGEGPNFSLLRKFDFIICGHVHEKWKFNGKNVNVGVDVWDMKPIHINELARFLRRLREGNV